ncbi:hypothetical protein TrLO_g13186 [Triparma laevis f. longispina]|uniref:Uncharacterized protein n=2 Tax=Triparma laevis TaxID=1534972 RepID=A0A9W7CI71_9STRA|nr:hypothetical protein TrLO_g13186 [Triparma laevis f. longispina]
MTIGECVLYVMYTYRDAKAYFVSLDLSPDTLKEYAVGKYEAIEGYVKSIDVDEDAKLSLQIGIALGIALLTFLIMFPGEPFDYTKLDGGKGTAEKEAKKEKGEKSSKKKKKKGKKEPEPSSSPSSKPSPELSATEIKDRDNTTKVTHEIDQDEQMSLDWDTQKIASKMKKAQKMFGLSDEQLALAIENAKKESRGEKLAANDVNFKAEGDGLSLSQKVDVVVYLGLFAALFYFTRRDFGASSARTFRSYFPREAAALGITADLDEYVYNLKVHEREA